MINNALPTIGSTHSIPRIKLKLPQCNWWKANAIHIYVIHKTFFLHYNFRERQADTLMTYGGEELRQNKNAMEM